MLTSEVLLFNDAAGLIVGPVTVNILPEKTHFAVDLACKETGNAILRELAFVKAVKVTDTLMYMVTILPTTV